MVHIAEHDIRFGVFIVMTMNSVVFQIVILRGLVTASQLEEHIISTGGTVHHKEKHGHKKKERGSKVSELLADVWITLQPADGGDTVLRTTRPYNPEDHTLQALQRVSFLFSSRWNILGIGK
jgi:hypothetical protein